MRYIILCLVPLPFLSAEFKDQQKKAARREMIELDVAARNLTSIIATGDKKMLEDTLERLVTWQIKDHPEHGKAFKEVIAAWEKSGAIKYAKSIHNEANAMRNYAAARGKFNATDWVRIEQGSIKILTACRGCHDMATKDGK